MAQMYRALRVITHGNATRGDNCYYGPPLKPGQEEYFGGGPVKRGVEFNLDHLPPNDVAKLVAMGAVEPVNKPAKTSAAKEK